MRSQTGLMAMAVAGCVMPACTPPMDTPEQDDADTTNATATTTTTPGTTTTSPDPTTTSMTDASATAVAESSTGGSSTGQVTTIEPPSIDFGSIPDAPPVDTTCTEVDFMFVIDNSGSMSSHQANLIANFPAFIDGIQTTLEGVDSYQVGVITTDTYSQNIPNCQNLSSLVVQTQAGGACGPYADGANYMTEMDDLATSFSCAAQVGTVGNATERAMQAMVETVQKIEGDPGECNEGFIRDDALLVIVVITDEPDNTSIGNPMTWYDEVLLAKAGIPENVVVVSIINTPAGGCSGGVANNMAMFTDMWGDNGFQVPICAPDYAPFFDEAVGIIDVACENYIPPN